MVSSTIVKSSLVAACGAPGTGTCAPSGGGAGEGGTGVSGDMTCPEGASSKTVPSLSLIHI
eukprot:14068718-Alexandrium_andersonii.AAC.1